MAGGIDGDCRGERRARCAGEERRCDREGSGACPEVHVASSEAGCLRMRRLRIGNILDRRVRASIATEAETMSLPCDERARRCKMIEVAEIRRPPGARRLTAFPRCGGSRHALAYPFRQCVGSRSEERRVGKESVSTCRSRWSRYK